MTASQFQNQQAFFLDQVKALKQMFEESPLRKWIIMAGASGIVIAAIELLRMLWAIWRYVGKF